MNLAERDMKHIWHPGSQMKDYEELKPIVIDHGEGIYLYDESGKEYIDIISSWWCNLLGHCNPKISKAISKQMDKLEHVILANFSHKPVIELCEELVKLMPKGLEKFSFMDCGSAAIEAALKLAFQYQYQTGHPEKQKFMCLSDGYHGETLGALAVGGMDFYAKMYKPMLMDTIHIEAPDCYRCPYGKNRDNCNTECFCQAEEVFAKHGHECCAMILEPLIQGSAGMRIYPAEYLAKMRKLCDEYNVLLIVDEIAMGYGRTGKMWAVDHAGITPDIMCVSKGLTGGYMPMAITITTKKVYDAFYCDYNKHKEFLHSHTYSGNPLGCAAALAVLKIMKEENILKKANENAIYLNKELNMALKDKSYVGEIRHMGLINAIEIVKDKDTKQAYPSEKRIGYEIYKIALKNGLILRPLGDVLYFNPPLNITKEEIDKTIKLTVKSIDEIIFKI